MTDEVVKDQEEVVVDKPKDEAPVLSEVEQSAVTFGWQPREAWVKDGKSKEDWVPAKQFMKFGDLKQQLIAKDKQLNKSEKIIKLMKDHHLQVRESAYKEAVNALKAEKRAALEEQDFVAVEKIKDRIEAEKEKYAAQRTLPVDVERELAEPQQSTPPVEFFEFKESNPWYKLENQDEMSLEADKIGAGEFQFEAAKAQREGRQPDLKRVYKAVEVKIRKLYPEKFATPKSPQSDGGSRGSQGSSASSKLSEEEMQVAKAFNLTPEQFKSQQKSYKGR